MIPFMCPACKAQLDVRNALAGQMVKCPICSHVFQLPPTRGTEQQQAPAHQEERKTGSVPQVIDFYTAIVLGLGILVAGTFLGVCLGFFIWHRHHQPATPQEPAPQVVNHKTAPDHKPSKPVTTQKLPDAPPPAVIASPPSPPQKKANPKPHDDDPLLQDLPIASPTSDPTYMGQSASTWAKLLADADQDTSTQASKALFLIGDPAVPYVEKVLRSGKLFACNSAGITLTLLIMQQGSKAAVEALARAARSPNAIIRTTALVQLEQCGPAAKAALPVLDRLAKHPDPKLAKLAHKIADVVRGSSKQQ